MQWLAVRLQSFKAWFGDWENDPANASKVVDENGEPLVVAVKLDVGVGSNPKIVVNRISSLYGKERIETLLKHPALYVNTAKASRWVVDRGLQLPTVTNPSAGSNGRIQTPADLVKYKMESGYYVLAEWPESIGASQYEAGI